MSLNRKGFALVLLFLFVLLPVLWGKGKSEKQETEKVNIDNAVALVNGSPISKEVFDRELERVKIQFLMQGMELSGEQLTMVQEQVLEDLINQELVYQEGVKGGVSADEEYVQSQLSQIKANFPDDAAYQSALQEQALTEELLLVDIRRVYIIQKYIDDHFNDLIRISEEETRKFYDENPQYFEEPEQVSAKHILIQTNPSSTEEEKTEALKKITALRQRIDSGEDFSTLAKEFSDCPSGENGGDLGYFQRGDMVGPFEDAAFILSVGELSDVVETEFGYHLITVTDKTAASFVDYESVSFQIEEFLYETKLKDMIFQLIDELRGKAEIENLMK